jgi:uncharacterized protein
MQYNVAQLMKERTGATRAYTFHENIQNLDLNLSVLADLVGNVQLLQLGASVLVTGELRTRLELICDRCLTPINMPIRLTLEEEFKPTIDIESGEALDTTSDTADDANLINDHHIIDLSEVIRQQLWVNQPMHLLCKMDCKGLCPNCGQNWNEGPCDCQDTNIDPRWAALLELNHRRT